MGGAELTNRGQWCNKKSGHFRGRFREDLPGCGLDVVILFPLEPSGLEAYWPHRLEARATEK